MRQDRDALARRAADAARQDANFRAQADAAASEFENRLRRNPVLREIVESERRNASDKAERRRQDWERSQAARRRAEMAEWDWD